MCGLVSGWEGGEYRDGSTKSLLIFTTNLRRGVPTQHRPDFPHRGWGTVPLEILTGGFDPSGQVHRRASLGCILGNRDGLVNGYLRIFLFISIRVYWGGCLPLLLLPFLLLFILISFSLSSSLSLISLSIYIDISMCSYSSYSSLFTFSFLFFLIPLAIKLY